MAVLSIRGVAKRYGRTTALDDVSLDVRDGELLALLGPSGSGKSTILKLVAGIDAPDAGEIWLDDRRIDPLLPRHRDVAMVFQSYALYPHMTVAANIGFPLRASRVGRRETARRVEEVAGMLGVSDLLRRRPGQLSGGQQQRVALGRAIVRRPKLFLMDEPLSNLDAKLRTQMRLDLVQLQERLGVTTIYVTHDQTEAMTMGHRIAVIDDGRLHQVGTPEDVYEHPADLVVAGFVGSPPMNLFAVSELRAGGLDVALPFDVRSVGDAVLGVRPEHVTIGPDGFDARVVRVEPLGHQRLVHLEIGTTRIASWTPSGYRGRPGDHVRVRIEASGVRLFSASDGAAVPLRVPPGGA